VLQRPPGVGFGRKDSTSPQDHRRLEQSRRLWYFPDSRWIKPEGGNLILLAILDEERILATRRSLGAGPVDPHGGDLGRGTAVVLLVVGAVFGISGAVVLGSSRTIFPEPQPRGRLVRTGVYAIVRHPLYTSVILLSFAWALWWRSLPGLVSAATTVIFLDAKARSEEERLRARFLDYQGYAKRVKRLVPWIY